MKIQRRLRAWQTGEARFAPLDALLAQSLMRTLPADLAQKVRRHEGLAWNKGTTVTGLQVAWMIYDSFKTEDHASQAYGFNGIADLTWYGDTYD